MSLHFVSLAVLSLGSSAITGQTTDTEELKERTPDLINCGRAEIKRLLLQTRLACLSFVTPSLGL